jgi:hydrogenase-4 membrane subunit HyfE
MKKKGKDKIGKIITRNKAVISLTHFVLQENGTKLYSILLKY